MVVARVCIDTRYEGLRVRMARATIAQEKNDVPIKDEVVADFYHLSWSAWEV